MICGDFCIMKFVWSCVRCIDFFFFGGLFLGFLSCYWCRLCSFIWVEELFGVVCLRFLFSFVCIRIEKVFCKIFFMVFKYVFIGNMVLWDVLIFFFVIWWCFGLVFEVSIVLLNLFFFGVYISIGYFFF